MIQYKEHDHFPYPHRRKRGLSGDGEQGANTAAKFEYKVLAAARTSTMQKELQTAGQGGYRHI